MKILEWDSEFFGFAIGRADDGESADDALEHASEAGVACLYLSTPAADLAAVQRLVARGARLVDIRVELRRIGAPPRMPPGIRRASGDDDAVVSEGLSALSAYSRFSADDRFARDRVTEMYRVWGASLLDRGLVVVPDAGGGVVAASDSGGSVRLDLVWVDPAAAGRGLGRSLVEAALALGGREEAVVVTQAGNVAAVRLYEGCGFRIDDANVVVHAWLDEIR